MASGKRDLDFLNKLKKLQFLTKDLRSKLRLITRLASHITYIKTFYLNLVIPIYFVFICPIYVNVVHNDSTFKSKLNKPNKTFV